ncbi:MAG: SGNH/GDSL hydrolase family protein [Thermomicrobiales bacterium]
MARVTRIEPATDFRPMGEERHAHKQADATPSDDRSVHQRDTARLRVIAKRRRAFVGGGDPWRIFGAVAICLAITLLLNTRSFVTIAEEQPDGWARPVLLASAHGLDTIAGAMRFDRMNAWIDDTLHRRDNAPRFSSIAANPPTATLAPPAVIDAPADARTAPALEPTDDPTAATAAAPLGPPLPPAPVLRAVTTANPLRVYVAGDSFATWMGYDFADYAKRDDLITSLLDFKISSGLARPDYFDWPARLTEEMAGNPPPEAIVWFAGANDFVDMRTDAGSLTRGTPEWLAEYRKRAAAVMDIVGRGGGQMYWVGQPIMRDKARSNVAADINTVVQAEAESRPWVHYIDIWSMFTDASGNYAAFLPDTNGELVRVRQEEGIHLTRTATNWVSDRVYAVMRGDYKFAGGW